MLKKPILKPIAKLAQEKLGIEARHLDLYGPYRAKLSLEYIEELAARPDEKAAENIDIDADGQIIGLY